MAYNIKEKKDAMLSCIFKAKQITRTCGNLAYNKWESFQSSKTEKQALTMENLHTKQEVEEAFARKKD